MTKNASREIIRQAALDLSESYTVIPVRRDKESYIKWGKFQKCQSSTEEVTTWWKDFPDAQIAIVLKPGHVVFDIDDRGLGARLLKKTGIHERTRVEKSRRGLHIWFEEKSHKTKTSDLRRSLGIEAEIRAFGTYLVVPPSVGYELLSDLKPLEVDDAREEVMKLLASVGIVPKQEKSLPSQSISLGGRNNTLASIAGKLFRKGLEYEAVETELLKVNRERCSPPLSEREVKTIAQSIHKKHKGSVTLKESSVTDITWLTFDEMSKVVREEIDWVWEGYLAKGYITLLSGTPKAGKTTLLAHLIKAFSEKSEFVKHKTNLTGSPLILTEEYEQLYLKRIREMQITAPEYRLLTRYMAYGLTRESLLKVVERAIDDGTELIVIDTLSDFWGVKDENDATIVQEAMRQLREVVQRRKVALLLIHHLRKAEGEHGSGHRGSGALVGSVDIALELRRGNTKARRNLVSQSRFHETPDEHLIEYDQKVGFKSLGDPSAISREDTKKRFLEALTEEFQRLEAIAELMEPRPSAGILREIAAECRANKEVDFAGTGKSGSPYTYRRLDQ